MAERNQKPVEYILAGATVNECLKLDRTVLFLRLQREGTGTPFIRVIGFRDEANPHPYPSKDERKRFAWVQSVVPVSPRKAGETDDEQAEVKSVVCQMPGIGKLPIEFWHP